MVPDSTAPTVAYRQPEPPPKRAATLRTASESLRADPAPLRRSVDQTRKATAAEIAECLTFAGHAEPMMSKIAIERLLDHLGACGFVLMSKNERTNPDRPLPTVRGALQNGCQVDALCLTCDNVSRLGLLKLSDNGYGDVPLIRYGRGSSSPATRIGDLHACGFA